jgi:hypothetical protein
MFKKKHKMKALFLATALAGGLLAAAQNQDTIKITVNDQRIDVVVSNADTLTQDDYNKIIKKLTDEQDRIIERQKTDLARVDDRLAKGEITAEEAEKERLLIVKRNADAMAKTSEEIQKWATKQARELVPEDAEDIDEWISQWEENAGKYDGNQEPEPKKKGTTVIIDDDGIRIETDEEEWISPKKDKEEKKPATVGTFNFQWGWNNWFNDEGLVLNSPGELRGWNSGVFGFGWGGKTRIGSPNSKFYINYGGDFVWNNLRLKGDNILVKTANPDGTTIFTDDLSERNYEKSRLRMIYLDVPVMFQFDSSKKGTDNGFTLGVGGYGGVRLSSSTRVKFDDFNGDPVKEITWNNFYTNPFRYGVIAQIGFGSFKITAKYDLNTLFRQDKDTPDYQIGSLGFGFTSSF